MAGRSNALKAGGAFYELFVDDTELARGLRKAAARVQNFGTSLAYIGASITGVGTAMAAPLAYAVKVASDLEETMNKFNVVFGESADEIKAWGDDFAGQVGRSRKMVADFMAGSQDLFVPIGFDEKSATDMSKQITQLAIDLASFNNMADAGALRDLHAALTGSGEVMKKYGVIVSEAAVKQELLNTGFDPSAATDQQKVMARLSIIMRGTTAAQGDAIRSAGSFANQMKALTAQVGDAAAAFGTALLPTVTPVISLFSEIAKQAAGLIEAFPIIAKVALAVTASVLAIGTVLTVTGGAIIVFSAVLGGLATVVSTVSALAAAMLTPFGAVGAVLGLLSAALIAGAAYWLVYTEAGQQFMQSLAPIIGAVQEFASVFLQALQAGKYIEAGLLLFAGLNVVWQTGLTGLTTLWDAAVTGMINAMIAGAKTLISIVTSMVHGVLKALSVIPGTIDATMVGQVQAASNRAKSAVDAIGSHVKLSSDATLKAQQQALAKAIEEYQAMLEMARTETASTIDESSGIASKNFSKTLATAGMGGFTESQAATTAGAATRVVFGSQTGSREKQIAEASAETARNTRAIANNLRMQ